MTIIHSGRGRLIINEVGDKCGLTLDVNGAGYTILLDDEPAMEAAGAIIDRVRKIRKRIGPQASVSSPPGGARSPCEDSPPQP